jgi:hypothetical protein
VRGLKIAESKPEFRSLLEQYDGADGAHGCAVTAGQADMMVHFRKTVIVSENRMIRASAHAGSAAFAVTLIDSYLFIRQIRCIARIDSAVHNFQYPVDLMGEPNPIIREEIPSRSLT